MPPTVRRASDDDEVAVTAIGGKERDGKPAAIGRWTFETRKVRNEVEDELRGRVLNACAGKTKLRKPGVEIVRNDLNPDIDADLHVDIEEIGQHFEADSFDVVVLDPPFDQGQAEEHYGNLHARKLGKARKALASLVKPGGTIVEFGWSEWAAADYFDGWQRERVVRFRRGIPDRPPVFMVVDRNVQTKLPGGNNE